MIPKDVLLARALGALQGAQLELAAGKYDNAAEQMEKAMKLIEEALR